MIQLRTFRKILTSIIVVALFGCEQPANDVVRTYPVFTDTKITSNTKSGVRIETEIVIPPGVEVTDHGFIWGLNDKLSIEKSYSVHLGKPTTTSIKLDINRQLIADQTYYMRGFLITDKNKIYSEIQEFKSLGSDGVTITALEPALIDVGGELKIKGTGFGNKAEGALIALGAGVGNSPMSIKSISDNEIVTTLPEYWLSTAKIYLTIPGNSPIVSKELTIKIPKTYTIEPAPLCQPIKVPGEFLTSPVVPVVLNSQGQDITTTVTITPTLLTFPPSEHTGNLVFSLKYNRPAPTQYQIINRNYIKPFIPPIIETPVSTNVRAGDIVVLKGTNIPTCGSHRVFSANSIATLESISATEIRIKFLATPCNSPISVLWNYSNIYGGVFDGPAQEITSVTDRGLVNTDIVVRGTNLSGAKAYFQLKDTSNKLSLTSTFDTDTEVRFFIPPNLTPDMLQLNADGNALLSVQKCNRSSDFLFKLDTEEPKEPVIEKDPIISSLSPTALVVPGSFMINGSNLAGSGTNDVYLTAPAGSQRFPGVVREVTDTQMRVSILFDMIPSDGPYEVYLVKRGVTYYAGRLDIDVE